jgi:hypothetical protein
MRRLSQLIEEHVRGKKDPVIVMLSLINAKVDILSKEINNIRKDMNEKYEVLYAEQLLLKNEIKKLKQNFDKN